MGRAYNVIDADGHRNVEGKQVRRIMRYSGGHPKFRERCEAVVANGYRELSLA